jgi:phenylacetate-CoA ligase
MGELVLTTLGRIASPMLRYRTGDLVRSQPASPCACGRHELGLAGGILGRTDDMVVIRGVNVFPSSIDQIVRESGEVAEYRVEVSHRGVLSEISLQIEATPECQQASELVERLERKFEATLSLRVPVTLVPFQTLPRFEMKARRWVVVNAKR